ncbi:hypothetical protein ASD31_17430 [Rhizobium sp. Root482]|nr:hypothetical protein ASD31_17430 [Rhizobium sp. Root482]
MSIFRKSIRPSLRPMEDTQYSDCRLRHFVGDDIRRTRNDQFACPRDPARTPAFGKVLKPTGCGHNPFIDCDGGGRIIGLNMRE